MSEAELLIWYENFVNDRGLNNEFVTWMEVRGYEEGEIEATLEGARED